MVWKNEEESDSGHTVSALYKESVVTLWYVNSSKNDIKKKRKINPRKSLKTMWIPRRTNNKKNVDIRVSLIQNKDDNFNHCLN